MKCIIGGMELLHTAQPGAAIVALPQIIIFFQPAQPSPACQMNVLCFGFVFVMIGWPEIAHSFPRLCFVISIGLGRLPISQPQVTERFRVKTTCPIDQGDIFLIYSCRVAVAKGEEWKRRIRFKLYNILQACCTTANIIGSSRSYFEWKGGGGGNLGGIIGSRSP